jgi:hypothetical protein
MTAIDWLINELRPTICLPQKYVDEIKERAKAKEKQQIIDAYANGHNDGCLYMNNDKQTFEHVEAYYKDIYNQTNQ